MPFEAIAAPEALLRAWQRYARGKRRRPSVAAFAQRAEQHVLDLADALADGSYRPRTHRLLTVRDPKPRLIAIAPVRDRVVHRAIYDALAPDFHRGLTADTFACLEDRGSHRAILRFLDGMRRHRYVLHLDIQRYFPSVDHAVLRALLVPRLRDRRIHGLIDALLASGDRLYRRPEVVAFYPRDDLARGRGLPIGNLTSQWWANLYLSGFDHHVKRVLNVGTYLRYMDDLVLFDDDRARLRQHRAAIADWLCTERRLTLNGRKGHIRSTGQPQTYLGYRVSRAGIRVGSRAVHRLRQRLPELIAAGDAARLDASLDAWRAVATF
ncbi:MAG: reverse transcriptase domain-containing protein [Acidobacteriota bacterium]